MRSLARTGDFQSDGHAQLLARLRESSHVRPPLSLVEVDGKEMAGIIGQQWIDPDGVFAGKVGKNDFVGHWNQQTVAAVTTLDAWFFAYPGAPLVAASRSVTRLARCLAFPADWVDVYTAAKQPPEQSDLFIRGKMRGFRFPDGRLGQRRLPPLNPMGIQQRGEAVVFRLKRREPIPLGHGESISAASSFTYLP